MTIAERHWTVKGTAELNQSRYFRGVLTLKWNSVNILLWGRGLFPTENKRLWIPSSLMNIRFDWGYPTENLDYRHKERNLEKRQDR